MPGAVLQLSNVKACNLNRYLEGKEAALGRTL
jgi:hypothetical protein